MLVLAKIYQNHMVGQLDTPSTAGGPFLAQHLTDILLYSGTRVD